MFVQINSKYTSTARKKNEQELNKLKILKKTHINIYERRKISI